MYILILRFLIRSIRVSLREKGYEVEGLRVGFIFDYLFLVYLL